MIGDRQKVPDGLELGEDAAAAVPENLTGAVDRHHVAAGTGGVGILGVEELFKKEPGKALDMEQEALAKRAAACVVGIRGKDGNTITIDGKPLVFSDEFAERLFFENGDITGDVLTASLDSNMFK